MKENRLLIIIISSLLLIAASIAINLASFSDIEQTILDELKENQLTKTSFASKQIENHLIQVRDELVTLSKFPEIENLEKGRCSGETIVHEKIEGKLSNILRTDKEGNIIECSSPSYSHYLGINIQNKEYFQTPKYSNEPYIETSARQIIVSAPLFETTKYTPYPNFLGEFKGILMSIVEVSELYNLYIHPTINPEQNLFIVANTRTEETILKSNDLKDYSKLQDEITSSNEPNLIANFNGFGKTIMTSSDITVGSETWSLIILTPLKNTDTGIKSIQQRHLFLLVFVVLIIITGFFLLVSAYKSKEEVEEKLEKANVTLEQLGINIGFEDKTFNQADIVIKPKNVYLIKEDGENHAHELFISSLNRGFAGLGIVRENPEFLKKKYNLHKTSFIWLSKNQSKENPSEVDINNLYKLISEFVKKSSKSAILIDRMDYILTENSFERVIKIVYELKDLASINESIIIISINPDLIPEAQLKALETETIDLYGRHLNRKVDLSEQEMGILKLINDGNVSNKLVSFKDITKEFNITKPTTRAKIAGLQQHGLISVEQKGRFKSLKITSAGRRILN